MLLTANHCNIEQRKIATSIRAQLKTLNCNYKMKYFENNIKQAVFWGTMIQRSLEDNNKLRLLCQLLPN